MFPLLTTVVFLISDSAMAVTHETAPPPKQAAIVELFEDDADGLLKLLTNPGDAPGQGEAEPNIVFSGKKSLKVTQYQRFNRTLPGWNYAIREKPKPGEYRYLRFAWKVGQANCMMLQIHDATDWHIRYTAGPNPYGWATRFVAEKAPATWTLVTVDLFKDFGERTLTGMAFTIHGGSGYFDHVYLGRTLDDLDRIDANGLTKNGVKLVNADLERLWEELVTDDAAQKYRAFWTLVAGRDKSVAFIKNKLAAPKLLDSEEKQIRQWIRNLDSGAFSVRARASAELRKRLEAALPILETELPRTRSTEMRQRIVALIAAAPGRNQEQLRRQTALRILDYLATR